MEYGRKVSDELTSMGQVRVEQLQQAVEQKFGAVLNLRDPGELGFWAEEAAVAQRLGLHYVHIPLRLECLDEVVIARILHRLEQLPKPVLVHCAAGMRSTVISLLSTAIRDGLTPEQTVEKAYEIGFHYIDNTLVSPQLKQRFMDYIDRHAVVNRRAA